jgi:hypothetical protein
VPPTPTAAKKPKELLTLQFRYRPDLAGTVFVYELSPVFAARWWEMYGYHQQRHKNDDVQLPFRSLLTALRAISGTCVQLWVPSQGNPGIPKLVSRAPLDPDDRHDTFDFWAQAFDGPDSRWRVLGEHAAKAECDERPLTDFISRTRDGHGHQPVAPNWVFDLAEWNLMSRLAAVPFPTDEGEIRFRITTDGSLLCWDQGDLWASNPHPKTQQIRYSMARLEGRLKTSPDLHDPIIVLDGYASRLADRWNNVATAYLAPPQPNGPIIVADLDDVRRHPRLNTYAVQVVRRLHAQAPIHRKATLPTFPEELGGIKLDGAPGSIRALVPKSVPSPHGYGMGMEFFRRLNDHVISVVPELVEDRVRYVDTGLRFTHRNPFKGEDKDTKSQLEKRYRQAILPADLPDTVRASGVSRLRIVCLYCTPQTRARMLASLVKRLDLGAGFAPGNDQESVVCDGTISIVFHHVPEFLARGTGIDRGELIKDIPTLRSTPATRVVAWCETDYDPDVWFDTAEERRAYENSDAKFPAKQLLAGYGVVSQFLNFAEPADPGAIKRRVRKKDQQTHDTTSEDFPADRAQTDLLRSAGLLDGRLGFALGAKDNQQWWHVGVHVRRQNPPRFTRGKKPMARMTITLVAMRPTGGIDEPWEVLAYAPGIIGAHPTSAAGPGWRPYAEATAAFHAAPLAEGGLTDEDRKLVAKHVSTALAQLHLPYVVYVNAVACRRIWWGLQNQYLDDTPPADQRGIWLPGLDLPATQRPLSVVRINHERDEIGKPVGVPDGESWKNTNGFFRKVADGPRTTWMLCTVPRGYSESLNHRPGAKATRWDVEPIELRRVMYSHTGTEIYPIAVNDDDRERYAKIAARLIEQGASHDYRLTHPAPLHAARQMDEDHPHYRRTLAGDSTSSTAGPST